MRVPPDHPVPGAACAQEPLLRWPQSGVRRTAGADTADTAAGAGIQ